MSCNLKFIKYNSNVDSSTERKGASLSTLPHIYTKAEHGKAVFMNNFIDLTGQKFGKLTVLKRVDDHITKGGHRFTMYLCKCDCGNEIKVKGTCLRRGKTRSCGCLKVEAQRKLIKFNTTHSCSNTRLYRIWSHFKGRCNNPTDKAYKKYGGRGIKVCDEWQEFQPFYNWAMANGYSDNLTIDRIDVNGNYEPDNCRWTNYKIQVRNRRITKTVFYNGKEYPLGELAEMLKCDYKHLWYVLKRIKLGYSPSDIDYLFEHKELPNEVENV